MKRALYIFALMIAACCFVQQSVSAADHSCTGWFEGLPEHYCECSTTSQPFQFPLQVQVNATPQWFSATLDDMRQGLSAYWISDDTVAFEVYAFCTSAIPTITMTVGPNQMHEMSVDAINAKLAAMGEQAEQLGQLLTPRIRVYTVHGRTGTVYCYPYDKGPVSTCDTFLHVIPRMTYVCDQPEEVYVLRSEKIYSAGKGFIQWKQKKNKPANFRLTKDSCNGPEIDAFTLSDSLRVHVLNPDTLKSIRNAGDSIYIHVTHDSTYTGRMIFRNSIKWDEQRIDTTICQGKVLQLADTTLSESTFYGGDTLWKKADTLALTGYFLTIEPPTPIYDTLRLKAAKLPYSYRNNIIPKNGWGDYDFTIHQKGQCDQRYLVHVVHDSVRVETIVDTTLCLGKTIKFGGITYKTDTVIRDSAWTNADTWTVRDITLHFDDPELEYDTIDVPPSKMTNRGYWYADLRKYVHYGDTLIVVEKANTCTRWVQLHVGRDITMVQADMDTTLCVGRTMMINDKAFVRDTMVYDTIMVEGDEWQVGYITIHFAEPETEYDTIAVSPMLMTAEGYAYTDLDAVVAYGDTLIIKAEEDQCTRYIQLHVDEEPIPVTEIDTSLCLGKTVTLGEMTYASDTVFRDTVQTGETQWLIRDIVISFTEPELEYDTVYVTPEQMIPAGDTLIILTAEEECTRWIQRHIEITQSIDNVTNPAGAYKYLHRGVLYIRRLDTDYDLFGRIIEQKQNETQK